MFGRMDKLAASLPAWVGRKVGEMLEGGGVVSMEQLRQVQIEQLENVGITGGVG